MSWYQRHLVPYVIDLACGLGPIDKQRQKVVPAAEGEVLEIGIGTGHNLQHYDIDKVTSLTGIDPEVALHWLAKRRLAKTALDVSVLPLPAEEIPADDNFFDTVVCTYTLCTIPDTQQALAEMRRVLKPSGKLLFCEHGKAPDANVLQRQNRINPLWKKAFGGCNLQRAIPDLLTDAGFNVDQLEQAYLPKTIKIAGYNYWGIASK